MSRSNSTFLSTDPKARLLTKDAHIHHAKFHVWHREEKKIFLMAGSRKQWVSDADLTHIPLKNNASPPR